jgi:AcrR family transcriptional regulator
MGDQRTGRPVTGIRVPPLPPDVMAFRYVWGVPNQRDRVLSAAVKLFRRNGYHATTMDDVAADVGLNKGTLYHYFSSKSALLFAVFEERIAEGRSILPDLDALAPEAAVRRFIEHQVGTIWSSTDAVAVYYQESRFVQQYVDRQQYARIRAGEAEISAALERTIRRGIDAGDFADTDIFVAAQGIVGMCAWIVSWWEQARKRTMTEVADQYATVVLRGLRGS